MATMSTSSNLASFVVPAVPQLGIPAHSGALVLIPDGAGGTKSYGWFTAACSRIISQDATHLEHLFKQGLISFSVFEKACKHLGATCGAPDVPSWSERLHIGSSIFQHYGNISNEERVVWLRQDLDLRRSFLPGLQSMLESSRSVIALTLNSQERQGHIENANALEVWSNFNCQQIAHISNTQDQILALLPSNAAAKLAPRRQPDLLSSPGLSLPQSMEAKPIDNRQPLAPISANVSNSPPQEAGRRTESLKRKRADDAPKAKTEVISILEESEDEEELSSQIDALHAKIAQIRARTAHEDQLMPKPPPLSQNKKRGGAPQPLPSKKTKMDTKTPKTRSMQPLTASSQLMKTPSARNRLKVQAAGQPGVWIEPTSATTARKMIEVVKAQLKIPANQHSHLVFRGQKVSPDQRMDSIGSTDGDSIQLVVSSKGATSPASAAKAKSLQQKPAPKPTEVKSQPVPQRTLSTWFEEHGVDPVSVPPSSQRYMDKPLQPPASSRAGHSQPQTQLKQPATTTPQTKAPPPPVIDLTSRPSEPSPNQAQPPPRVEPILCQEQQEVVDLIMAGYNVFYTGSAGCGKSTVLKSFVPKLREQGKTVRIVAPTGKAALDINGSTTWTFAGWTPLHMKKPLKDLRAGANGTFVRRRLRDTDVLVIDEISMVENHLFERLNAIMKEARNDKRAFGGVQLIVTGDFCQLPPVKPFQHCIECGREQPRRVSASNRVVYRCPQHGDRFDDDKWAFRSVAWEQCQFKHINLTNIHRQSDEVFIKILQKLRVGNVLTQADRDLLINHPSNTENAVKLFPTRNEVMRINQTEFDKLPSEKRGYTCLDHFRWNEEKHPHLRSKGERQPYDGSLVALREHRLENYVEFRKDMLVVLLVNLDISAGLVNGSQGKIVDFEPYDPAKLPKASVSRDTGGSSSRSRSGFSSSQRSRGRRDRDGSVEPQGSYEKGELRGEYATFRETQIREFMQQDRNRYKAWPVVEFDNGLRRTIFADCQVNELGDEKEYTLLARTQIPLIAAWAMTIHKSQGMTLNRVIVDLGKSFEEGQEYVALSRARALDGLKVMALGDGVGKGGNAQVREFLWQKFKLR